ncbi:MAG: hypothetical protein KC900_05845 [Candidatus Omnitrophica bacterium]|nr:hypothetical protein [Candidatus Omnitrophota bacterium]
MSDLIQANETTLKKADLSVRILQFAIILTGIGFTCMLALIGAAQKWPALLLAAGYIVYLVNERSAFDRIRDDITREPAAACKLRCVKRTLTQALVGGPVVIAFIALFVHSVSDIPAWTVALPLAVMCAADFTAAQVLFRKFDDGTIQPYQQEES